jgi:uncharacterized membrane protein
MLFAAYAIFLALIVELGWVLVALAFGFPSTLTLVLPFVGLLAFPLAHISPYGPADHVRRAAA